MASDENGIDWKVEAVDWRNRYHGALKLMAERNKPCVWTLDEDNWFATECGSAFDYKCGAFCPDCGHPIEVTP